MFSAQTIENVQSEKKFRTIQVFVVAVLYKRKAVQHIVPPKKEINLTKLKTSSSLLSYGLHLEVVNFWKLDLISTKNIFLRIVMHFEFSAIRVLS
jgi:hypothetical protein